MSEFNKNEFDPKAAAEARKAELEEITKKLEKGVKDVFDGDNFKEYLNFCAKLPRYSVNNQLLIMMQRPDATMCQSFSNWKDMNRFVKKGEKGIRILAPSPYKMEKEQEKTDANGKAILDANGEPVKEKVEVTVNAFKPVSTFDISQTEGDPVPMVGVNELSGSVEDYEKLLNAIKEVVPVPVSFENIESGAKGYFHLEENRIVIQEGMSEVQTVKTFIHEAAHQALHSREAYDKNADKKTQNQKETEAESVAYVVCAHYGIDTSDYSFPYVATWSADKEVPELKTSLDIIRRTASDLIVKIDDIVLGRQQEEMKDISDMIDALSGEMPFDLPSSPVTEECASVTSNETNSEAKDAPIEEKQEDKTEKTEATSKGEKKPSILKKLKEEKDKLKKTTSVNKTPNRDLQNAI